MKRVMAGSSRFVAGLIAFVGLFSVVPLAHADALSTGLFTSYFLLDQMNHGRRSDGGGLAPEGATGYQEARYYIQDGPNVKVCVKEPLDDPSLRYQELMVRNGKCMVRVVRERETNSFLHKSTITYEPAKALLIQDYLDSQFGKGRVKYLRMGWGRDGQLIIYYKDMDVALNTHVDREAPDGRHD